MVIDEDLNVQQFADNLDFTPPYIDAVNLKRKKNAQKRFKLKQ